MLLDLRSLLEDSTPKLLPARRRIQGGEAVRPIIGSATQAATSDNPPEDVRGTE